MLKSIVALFCCALFIAVLPANADQWDKKTIMTFNQPVELPGVVLPAGTYVFRLLDSTADRHVVRVFNEDGTQVLATILAIPDYRLTPHGETVVRFQERPIGSPAAVKAWFYPGDNFGQEFVYPKARAVEIAETAKEPVLAAEVKPAEPLEELVKEPVIAITPEKREVEVAEVIQPKPVEAPAAPAPVKELPKTASPLPLIGLLGFASLGLAGLLRVIAKHTS